MSPIPGSSSLPAKAVRRSAWARSASGVFADSTHGTTDGACPTLSSSTGSTAGACSRITCALVPLTPKEETAARRGRSTSGHT